MKYQIELSEEQMILVANCLEDVSRFASGQIELKNTIIEMIKDMPFEKRIKKRSKVESFLEKVKKSFIARPFRKRSKKIQCHSVYWQYISDLQNNFTSISKR